MSSFKLFTYKVWISVFAIGLTSSSTSLWAMDEALRGACRLGLMEGDGAAIARGLQMRLRTESIDTAGNAMIEALQASNFQVDPSNPRPRPEIDRPEIRAMWEEVVQGRLAQRSLFIQRMNEAEQLAVAPEGNPLTMGRLIPKIISSQFRLIPKGIYFIGETGKDEEGNPKGMWVEVKTDRYIQRGLVSRAQFKKVMGYDSVAHWWQELLTEDERQMFTQDRSERWRQATQIPEEELGNYPATQVDSEQADEYAQRLGGDFRLPTVWEQMVFMHAGRKKILKKEQRREIIYNGNSQGRLHETGEMESNPWDIHNALGNSWQWSSTFFNPFPHPRITSTYPRTTKKSPVDIDDLAKQNSGTGSLRVFLGGGWFFYASNCLPGYWFNHNPVFRHHDLGFRVLRTVEE